MKLSSAQTIIIGVVLLIVGLSFFIFKRNSEQSYDQAASVSRSEQRALPALDVLMDFVEPEGWIITNNPTWSIYSPDFKMGDIAPIQGTAIYISYVFANSALESEKENWKDTAGVSEIIDSSIDNIPAIRFRRDFEGQRGFGFVVVNRGYNFTITTSSPSFSEAAKYQKEIDNFISSINLK